MAKEIVVGVNDHDVLCGRGSGPNDHAGNVAFRALVSERKGEYLTVTRAVKLRIATEIVAVIRGRGGRFLKKLSAAQVEEAGLEKGTAVYELADEGTVLEKAKQSLRQNGAEYAQQIKMGRGVPAGMAPEITAVAKVETSSVMVDNGVKGNAPSTTTQQQQPLPVTTSSQPTPQDSMNPIPLCDTSAVLDSKRYPNFSSLTTDQLNRILFASSRSAMNNNTSNDNLCSMTTAELCAAMEVSFNKYLQTPNTSMSSNSGDTQSVGSLLRGLNSDQEKTLIEQYEQLQAQQQMILQQQQQLKPLSFPLNNTPSIPEEQHQVQLQQQQQQELAPQDFPFNNMQPGAIPEQFCIPEEQQQVQLQQQPQLDQENVFSALLKQYDNIETQSTNPQRLQQYEPHVPIITDETAPNVDALPDLHTRQRFAHDRQPESQQVGYSREQQQQGSFRKQVTDTQQTTVKEEDSMKGRYVDSSVPTKQSSDGGLSFDPLRRRKSRRCPSSQAAEKPADSSLEPADYFNEESVRLSFLTANRLVHTLAEDSSMTSIGSQSAWAKNSLIGTPGPSTKNGLKQSATSNGASWKNALDFDCSMFSLMSLSSADVLPVDDKSLLDPPPHHKLPSGHKKGPDIDEDVDKIRVPPTSKAALVDNEEEDMRFGESIMSFGLTSDD